MGVHVSHEVQREIPARTRLEVIVAWKRYWRTGWIRLTNSAGRKVDVPFKYIHDVDFDRRSISTRAVTPGAAGDGSGWFTR